MSADAVSGHDRELSGDSLYHPKFGPLAYPACSTCHVPYMLKRSYIVSKGVEWVWFRDCKHKGIPAASIVENYADDAG